MADNIYIENPENEVSIITFDLPIYNPDTDSKCKTPQILGFAIEGSSDLLVGADLLLEGVELVLNTGETAIVTNGVAIFELVTPLAFGQEIWAEVNTDDCQSRSCSVFAARIANVCLAESTQQVSGALTGRFICVEKDLYATTYDGDGGINQGVLRQEDCFICAGSLPNCLEPPTPETTLYNIIGCNDGLTYQTATAITISNQRVVDNSGKTYRWAGTTTTTATNYVGVVNIVSGQTGCPTTEITCNNYEIIGGSGGGTYSYIDCLDGQTYGPYNLPESLVSNRCARNAWGTNVTVNKGTVCGF